MIGACLGLLMFEQCYCKPNQVWNPTKMFPVPENTADFDLRWTISVAS